MRPAHAASAAPQITQVHMHALLKVCTVPPGKPLLHVKYRYNSYMQDNECPGTCTKLPASTMQAA
jgi:hypothetical protein